jgi:hypothetical protein
LEEDLGLEVHRKAVGRSPVEELHREEQLGELHKAMQLGEHMVTLKVADKGSHKGPRADRLEARMPAVAAGKWSSRVREAEPVGDSVPVEAVPGTGTGLEEGMQQVERHRAAEEFHTDSGTLEGGLDVRMKEERWRSNVAMRMDEGNVSRRFLTV